MLRRVLVLFALVVSLGVVTPTASATVGTCPGALGHYGCEDAQNNIAAYMIPNFPAGNGYWLRDNNIDCWRNSAWTNNNLYARCGHYLTWVYNIPGTSHGYLRSVYLQWNVFNVPPVRFWPNQCPYNAPTWYSRGNFGSLRIYPRSYFSSTGLYSVMTCLQTQRYGEFVEWSGFDF